MVLNDKDQYLDKAARSDINAAESPSVSLAEEVIDKASETKLLAKLDAFLVPIIMLVYLSCFLDRANIVCSRANGNVFHPTDEFAGKREDSRHAKGHSRLNAAILDGCVYLLCDLCRV